MKYAIIAAGNGSRLAQEGVGVPKPLVRINGERLIDRLIRIFAENGATEIAVVCNEEMSEVSRHLADIAENGLCGHPVPLRFVVRSTPSSMHSFHALSGLMGGGPFVLTTVDTVFREDEFSRYVRAFSEAAGHGTDALMGVTDYIDDEKPLYVGTTDGGRAHGGPSAAAPLPGQLAVTGFYDLPDPPCRYISAGIYGLTAPCLDTLRACIGRGESRMRNFQRALLSDGLRVAAHAFSKVIDIDHAGDIEKAERLVQPHNAPHHAADTACRPQEE
ncbi:nucleotidyltransferase family protein [Prevotella dentasini]